jgi:type VI secretion system secreted protein VgrG
MTAAAHSIEFICGGLEDDVTLEVRHVKGREELSRLFHFDLVLKHGSALTPDQLDTLLKAPCVMSLGYGEHDLVHGILESIQLLEALDGDHATYRARMVPSAYLLTLARTNRIFQKMTVAKMIETILATYGLRPGTDFAMLISGGVEHEYVIQYEESDWDFIQRWLEHEGCYYWFEHGSSGEKIVFADSNDDATAIADPVEIPHRYRNNLNAGVESIWDWNFVQKRIPARVSVVDYNYRTPHIPLVATAPADEQRGFGTVFHYNEHFKDVDAGKRIAKLRAERHVCERRTLLGKSDCARLRVGHTFRLDGHYDQSQDGDYLITAIDHEGGIMAAERLDGAAYRAQFEAIPIATQFRPACITPWPSIHGVIHAHVDADSDGEFAQIDDKGRYRVRMPFDGSGRKGSEASRWVRKAQPYSGAGYGQHFPLHKGAEVLIAHIDGDPDRPIIVGAVPSMHTPSPSTSANATQSVIQTASGIRIEMEDLQS